MPPPPPPQPPLVMLPPPSVVARCKAAPPGCRRILHDRTSRSGPPPRPQPPPLELDFDGRSRRSSSSATSAPCGRDEALAGKGRGGASLSSLLLPPSLVNAAATTPSSSHEGDAWRKATRRTTVPSPAPSPSPTRPRLSPTLPSLPILQSISSTSSSIFTVPPRPSSSLLPPSPLSSIPAPTLARNGVGEVLPHAPSTDDDTRHPHTGTCCVVRVWLPRLASHVAARIFKTMTYCFAIHRRLERNGVDDRSQYRYQSATTAANDMARCAAKKKSGWLTAPTLTCVAGHKFVSIARIFTSKTPLESSCFSLFI